MIEGRDLIAVPMSYHDEFRRDPMDSLLKYGSMPQRARAPWFTDTEAIEVSIQLPDQVIGPRAERPDPKHEYKSIVASADPFSLIEGIAPYFRSTDPSFWHVHVDLALNKKRHGDAAGIAMGRISSYATETADHPIMGRYERIVRAYEVPLVAQILAPTGDQIYISSITRFILQLKALRGFNITSFSFDGFQSSDASQQLALAGLVTAGMDWDKDTGEIVGMPKPFSVDGSNVQPYREVLEGCNERRILLPKYMLLRKELRELEVTQPGRAPDHPMTGSKDVADPVAGVVGYLATYGHAELNMPETVIVDRGDLQQPYDLPQQPVFGIEEAEGDMDWNFDTVGEGFNVE